MDMGSSECISGEAMTYQGLDSGFHKAADSRVDLGVYKHKA